MDTTVTNRAVLAFEGDTGRPVRLSVPRAKMALTEAGAMAAMHGIVATGAVLTANGAPVAPVSAELVSTARERLA